jgi:8-oxo-dGTP pyrophosphatase MutT (NUDIX family)
MYYGKALAEFDPQQNCNLVFHNTSHNNQGLNKVNECGVILFNFNMSNILVVLQKLSRKWGFPKGHMNLQEKERREFFKCAKRELLEETNIDLRTHPHTKYGTLLIANKLFYIIGLKTTVLCARPNDPKEISQIKWVNRNDLYNFVSRNACNITLRQLF